jgi:hypothetical protein
MGGDEIAVEEMSVIEFLQHIDAVMQCLEFGKYGNGEPLGLFGYGSLVANVRGDIWDFTVALKKGDKNDKVL